MGCIPIHLTFGFHTFIYVFHICMNVTCVLLLEDDDIYIVDVVFKDLYNNPFQH